MQPGEQDVGECGLGVEVASQLQRTWSIIFFGRSCQPDLVAKPATSDSPAGTAASLPPSAMSLISRRYYSHVTDDEALQAHADS